jgi:hypothetical protein
LALRRFGVAFGTLATFAKIAYGTRADPFPVRAVRFLLTALILGGYLVAARRWVELHPGTTARPGMSTVTCPT